ncbi:hypothetical protein N7509_007397 [Penicillium cosmopolitanum]|uniref:Branched-chain-amino-acid aminotransferase n=1 Tax=Penicillium cosmopolitanum TaxID=1131564 RepID=A0A9W9VZ08_9EURO|nr:uncharacterized protein N7509_007397 [Penicillium cosmopolitanum]KAJ5391907.1 hypothetical protein N7509_007397 [Penicillium cosmopolitanum]
MTSMDKVFSAYAARNASLESSSNPFAKGIAWVEGQLVPFDQARIPLRDQGFMHGDLTYDVPSIWDGRFFRLDDHLARLDASCHKMRMQLPLPKEDIKSTLEEMVAKSGIKDAFVELIVTRGLVGVRGSKAEDITKQNLYIAIIARTVRRTPVGSFDPTIKNLQWGDLTRGLFEASDRGADYPFLTDGDGNLTEGSGFNIVLVKNGILYTPQRGVLEGVTRKSVIDVARANGIEVRVEFVPTESVYQCDELFMCTTAGGIMPITSLDGKPVGNGQLGPLTKRIWDGYWAMHYDPAYSYALTYTDSSRAQRL